MQDFVSGRCGWCGTDELYVKYHDQEWGNLVTDDKTLFEFLALDIRMVDHHLCSHYGMLLFLSGRKRTGLCSKETGAD